MERADLATMENTLREAFIAAGDDVKERKTVTGRAFLVGGRAVGQYEERAGLLRARLWLADKDRAAFEARPTFDRDSGWLHVVSDDDVRFTRGLIPAAYRAAAGGKGSPPTARTVEISNATVAAEVKRKSAASPRRPPVRPTRTR